MPADAEALPLVPTELLPLPPAPEPAADAVLPPPDADIIALRSMNCPPPADAELPPAALPLDEPPVTEPPPVAAPAVLPATRQPVNVI